MQHLASATRFLTSDLWPIHPQTRSVQFITATWRTRANVWWTSISTKTAWDQQIPFWHL